LQQWGVIIALCFYGFGRSSGGDGGSWRGSKSMRVVVIVVVARDCNPSKSDICRRLSEGKKKREKKKTKQG